MKIKKNRDNDIVSNMLRFQNELKLYHWNTFSFSRHKSTDYLFKEMIKFIDEFVEEYMGRFGRLELEKEVKISLQKYNDKDAIRLLERFAIYLQDLETKIPQRSNISALMNKRDEILGNVYRTIYLFSLD